MVNIVAALDKVKKDFNQIIPSKMILWVCGDLGYQFRQRVLGPVETFYLMLVQILHGNTACGHLRHLADVDCSVSAYCRARGRLPVTLLRRLLTWVCQSLRDMTESVGPWHGHRVFHVDGSSFSVAHDVRRPPVAVGFANARRSVARRIQYPDRLHSGHPPYRRRAH